MFHGCKCKLKREYARAPLPHAVNQSTSDLRAATSICAKNRSRAFCSFQRRSGRLFEERMPLLRRSGIEAPPPPTFTAPLAGVCTFLFSFEVYGAATKHHRIMDNSQFSRLIDFLMKINKLVNVSPGKSPATPTQPHTKTVLKRSVVQKMPCNSLNVIVNCSLLTN